MTADRELHQHSAILNRAAGAGSSPWAPGALAPETRAAADRAMAELQDRADDAGVVWLLADPHQLAAIDPPAQGHTVDSNHTAVRAATDAATEAAAGYVFLDRGAADPVDDDADGTDTGAER